MERFLMDRRDFLKATIGLPTVLTLPEWGRTPVLLHVVSPAESGVEVELPPPDAEVFNTTCQYCHVQCGYKVFVWERGKGLKPKGSYTEDLTGEWVSPAFFVPAVKDGKQVYFVVMPDKDNLVNEGDYSVRGGTMAETIFGPGLPAEEDRLRYPMIRKGGKGSPLERVSWEEAIQFTAQKLSELKSQFGPDSLALVWGDWLYTLPTHAILKFWFVGLGSSAHTGNGWFWDEESAGISAAFGTGTRSFTIEDFEETRLLVTAGKNLQATGSIWYHRFYWNNMAKGRAKHIVIDPRRTFEAQIAEEFDGLHLQIRPGTDAILAAALMQIIISQDAYDKDFVSKYVSGFDVVKETVMDRRFSVEEAARATAIPADKIKQAADLLIENQGATMILGEKGIMHQMGAFENQHAYAVLGIILGNVGQPGATVARGAGHPRGTFWWPPEPPSRPQNKHLPTLLDQGKVKAIWAFGSNAFVQLPTQTKYRPLMAQTFLIVQDRIETEMNEAADVVFPAATWGEMEGIFATEDRRVRLQQKFMDPPGEAKPDWWIVAQVAKAMGISGFDWQRPQEIWDEIRANNDWVKEITWDMLLEAGTEGIQYPFINGRSVERLFSDQQEAIMGKRFFTDDGKIHVEKIAVLKDFDPRKYEWGEVDADYPLMAYDFRLNERWNTGYTYFYKPTVSARTPEAYLLIHPTDAEPRGIKTGDLVAMRSRYGQMKVKARVSTDTLPGTVGIPALFTGEGNFNWVTRPDPSPVNGDVVTMVAVQVEKA